MFAVLLLLDDSFRNIYSHVLLQTFQLSLQALGLAIPVHGAPESPLPALEDWNVFPIWDASTRLWRSPGHEDIVGAVQLLQLLPAPPEPCGKHIIRHNSGKTRRLK